MSFSADYKAAMESKDPAKSKAVVEAECNRINRITCKDARRKAHIAFKAVVDDYWAPDKGSDK